MPETRFRTAVLLVLFAGACDRTTAAGQPGAPPPMGVKLVALAPTEIHDATEYIGTLKSRRSITVQPQVEGQLLKILVKPGDVVEAGTPLMQIDPARQRATVSSAQATRASRLATLAYAKGQLERIERLYQEDAVSRQELDQARASFQAALADANALGAQIRENAVQLQYYRITAPARGVVGDIPVRVGDRVTPQTVLTTIDDNTALESYISVPIERAGQLRLGMDVHLFDTARTAVGTGKVHFISPQVSPETQSILIKTDVPNQSGALRAEQFVLARVVWSTHQGLKVPALAVVRLNGQTFVFVAETHGGRLVAKQRAIAVGELTNDAYVVTAGLKPGEKVVASGVVKLRDGAPIAAERS